MQRLRRCAARRATDADTAIPSFDFDFYDARPVKQRDQPLDASHVHRERRSLACSGQFVASLKLI